MRKHPPVGTPLRYDEIAAAFGAGPEAEERLRQALQARIPAQRVFLFGSGRAALAALLVALHRLRGRTRVIVPGYTCWSVPAAIVRAGLRVLPADMQPGTIDFDLERLARLDWKDVLAVISPNLFGLPGDLTRLQGLAEANQAVLIDDAAQALGASLRGFPVGAHGVAGIVSFGRGKNVTALGGGAALVRDEELAQAMEKTADDFRSGPPPAALEVMGRGAAMRFALSPLLFGLASALPGASVGQTVYEPNFPVPAMGAARAAVAARVLERLDQINQRRGQQAEMADRLLGDSKALILPRPRSGAVPAWLRRPVLTAETEKRDELLAAWQAAGLGATAMYPAPVHKIPGLEADLDLRGLPLPGAERLASSLIALSLVESVQTADFQAAAAICDQILGRRRADRWV